MSELYRLRTMDRLFGDSQELENQTIYFASTKELNDPTEGLLDIIWHGDRIAWTNVFRHYLYCLHMTYVHFRVIGETKTLQPHDIPVMSDIGQDTTPATLNLFEDICGRVFKKTDLNEFIAKIVDAKRTVHRDEILFYLQLLHDTALQKIQAAHIDHGLLADGEGGKTFPPVFRHVHKMIDLIPQIESKRVLDIMFETSSRIIEEMFFGYKYIRRSESTNNITVNQQLLICDFPKVYLAQLERLLFPDWYVACFMRDYRNSATWGHYGDNHKGACLIFRAETPSGRNSLTLNQLNGYSNNRELWKTSPMNFSEVKYGDKSGEIDFFRSIGRLPEEKLIEVWYSDIDGNLSECSDHLGTNTDSWRKNHWNTFYAKTTIKTRDWEYEQESRLILYSLIGDLSEPEYRKLTYNFSSLKGVIFGIRTPDFDKLKIIETIQKKCQEKNRTDFGFFQAYYCHETGGIKKYQLGLKVSA